MNSECEKAFEQWFGKYSGTVDSKCENPLDKLTVYYDTEQLFTEKGQGEDISEHPVYEKYAGDFNALFALMESCSATVYEVCDFLRELSNRRVCEAFIEAMEAGLINPQDL